MGSGEDAIFAPLQADGANNNDNETILIGIRMMSFKALGTSKQTDSSGKQIMCDKVVSYKRKASD